MPVDPADGSVYTTGNGVGARATYACNTGFILNGPYARTCDVYGAWTGSQPTCDPGIMSFQCLQNQIEN